LKQRINPDIRAARHEIIHSLCEAGIHNPYQEADIILSSLLDVSTTYVHAHPERVLSPNEYTSLLDVITRRCTREPLQYILGETEFYGYSIEVGQGCLVPRPETELLVEHALHNFSQGTFLDWGTGTGCISVAMLKERPSALSVSVDISPQALSWAWKNLTSHGLLGRSLLWHSWDVKDIPVPDDSLDLAVSNPPYISGSLIPELMPEVRFFEPHLALDGGNDGLALYRPFLKWVSCKLKKEAAVIVEIGGEEQATILMHLKIEGLEFEHVWEDLANIPRMVCWRRV
jgi:release factor glutamine methyltransferase